MANTRVLIYQEQKDLATRLVGKIMSYWNLNDHVKECPSISFFIASATQSGKTRAMIEILRELHEKNQDKKIYAVIVGPPTKDIKEATYDDFEKTLFYDLEIAPHKVEYQKQCGSKNTRYHLSYCSDNRNNDVLELLAAWRKDSKNIIVFFCDEADYASGGGTNKSGDPLSKIRTFCAKEHIPLFGESSLETNEALEIGIHITATPAHLSPVMKPYLNNQSSSLYVEYFKLSPSYKGLDSLKEAGHFKKVPSSSAEELVVKRIREDLAKNEPLYHIIRSTKRNQDKIVSHLKEVFKDKFTWDCFDSASGNISQLSNTLKTKPVKPYIIFVKQGFTRGSRIEDSQYIGTWYTKKGGGKGADDAGVIQDVGRLTGYNKIWHPRLRVYCDMLTIDKEVQVISAQREDNQELLMTVLKTLPAQTGTHAKPTASGHKKKYKSLTPFPFDKIEDMHDYIRTYHPDDKYQSLHTCSEQNKHDIAKEYLESLSHYHETLFKNGKYYSAFYLDAPNDNHVPSWEKMDSRHKGKYVLVEAEKEDKKSKTVLLSAKDQLLSEKVRLSL